MSSHFKSRRRPTQRTSEAAQAWSGLETLEGRTYMSAGPVEFAAMIDSASAIGSVAQMHSLSNSINQLDEIDMFSINVEAGQKYMFDIDSDGSLDSYLRIFDENGKQVGSNNNGKAYGEDKSTDSYKAVTFKTGGTYFIGISASGNNKYNIITDAGVKEGKTTGSYELNITNITPEDTAGKGILDSLDLGILDGETVVQEFVGGSDKIDYYRFTIEGDATFTLSLTDMMGDADVRIARDDNYNNKIAKSEVVGSSATKGMDDEIITAELTAGTYCIEVKRKKADTYYTMTLNAELAEVEVVTPEEDPTPVQPDVVPEPDPTPEPEPEPAPVPVSDWFSQNLSDSGIITLSRSLFVDGSLSRGDMMLILHVAGDDDGIVDANELADLRLIVTSANTLGMSDDVRVLAAKVVTNQTANAKYQGSNLGNLAAGSGDAQLDILIDKWFMGSDRPNATIYGSTYQYRQANGSLFVNGPSLTDIKQGYVGDCYLLATLGSVAMIDPQAITDMFINNGDGTYAVRFFRNGVADYVTVDMYLPTDSGGRFIFANMGGTASSSSNELWVGLAEKAYAQLNEAGWIGQDGTNSYAGIEGGWMESVYEQLLGRNANSSYMPSQQTLINAFNNGTMVTLGTNNTTSNGIIAGHAYVLKNYNASTGTFDLYNPWGTQHATGVTYATISANFSWMASA